MKGWLQHILAGAVLTIALGVSPAPLREAAAQAPASRAARVVRNSTQATTRADGKDEPKGKTAPTGKPALTTCRTLHDKGQYDRAAGGYEKLIADRSLRVAAAIGLSEALAMRGKYAEATAALRRVEDQGAARAGWHLAMAEVLETVGRYQAALKHAETAEKLDANRAPAILVRGPLLETLGRKKQAVEVYRSMSRVVDADDYRRDARSLVALGRILDRFAVLTGQKASEQAPNILHNYLQEAYQRVDKRYWPAHVAAGIFLLSKHRTASAGTEFKLAARLNPRIPGVHVGRGAIALESWRFERCLSEADRALKINPRHSGALLLKAACLMQWRKFDQVAPAVEKVLETNPNHLEALSLLAALHVRRNQPDKAKPYIDRVAKINPGYSSLPSTIGRWLAAGRQFEQAEKHYRRAMALAPELAGPVTDLGLLYMQTGDEDKARTTLEKARQIDDYRKDVRNYLDVLNDLKGFTVRRTKHFILKVDGKRDAVLLGRMAAYLEKIYDEVCGDFEHEPPAETIVEVFPTHAGFSKRISGRAWIGTIGACTGRVIAMVAPHRTRSRFGTYNWPNVLRHEFAHAVTLSATKNRLPHWFTEACAVWQQPERRSYDAVECLVKAVRKGRLFPIRKLDWGFIRPKRRGDRELAYAQAEWVMEHIIATRKFGAVARMLRAFGEGKSQPEVFREVLGIGEAEFDKAFATWAKQQVRRWGFDPAAPPDYTKARKAVKKNPESAAAHANLALAQLVRRKAEGAETAARKALELDENNTRALGVLALVLVKGEHYEEAIEIAERLTKLRSDSRIAPRVLADSYLKKHRWGRAIAALETLKLRQPLAPHSYQELARIYVQLGLPAKALPNLIELHRRTLKDPTYARQIAEIYGTDPAQEDKALAFWDEVVHINPYEAGAYKAMTEIHVRARRYERAVAAAEEMRLADSESAESWTYVAIARFRLGKARKDADQLRQARKAANRALKIDPGAPQAQEVRELIDNALGEGKS